MKTNFDHIRDALARNDAGAERNFQLTAAQVYSLMGSEISLPYYELVIIAAEHAQRQGLRTRAETLLRRAILLAGHIGEDPLDAKGRLEKSAEWPRMPAGLSSERIVIVIDTECRLWGWQPQSIGFGPSSPMSYRWYMLAPAGWRQQLQARAAAMLETIFARCNARLAAQEPNDANYIGAQPTNIQDMTREQVLNEAWQVKSTAWSRERAFVVEDNGVYFPSDPNDFVPMAHLALVTAGLLETETSIANLQKVGFSGAVIERQRNPARELAESLAYYVRDRTNEM